MLKVGWLLGAFFLSVSGCGSRSGLDFGRTDVVTLTANPTGGVQSLDSSATAGNSGATNIVLSGGNHSISSAGTAGIGGRSQTTGGATPSGTTGGSTARPSQYASVVAGDYHTCALVGSWGCNKGCGVRTVGTVQCWGANSSGQLGNGSNVNSAVPVLVSGITDARAVAAGHDYSCALLNGGQVECWGRNAVGQLGNGTSVDSTVPLPVTGVTNAVAISAGSEHSCALLSDGKSQCWGFNADGQLGDGSTANSTVPVTVIVLDESPLVSQGIQAGLNYSCAVSQVGTARCWGSNAYGQLGNGSLLDSTAAVVVLGISNAATIAPSAINTCALLADGTVQCWGANSSGQLGNASNRGSPVPVTVLGISQATSLAVGGVHTCAASEGVQCWGWNASGQLGDGSRTNSNAAVTVTGINTGATDALGVVTITSGAVHSCVLADRSDGPDSHRIMCWGANSFGQLGNGTYADSSVPVIVP